MLHMSGKSWKKNKEILVIHVKSHRLIAPLESFSSIENALNLYIENSECTSEENVLFQLIMAKTITYKHNSRVMTVTLKIVLIIFIRTQ